MLPLLVSASPRRVQGVSGAPSPRVPPQNPARGRARAPVPLLWRSLQPRARPHGDCRLHSNLIHSHSDILSRVLASSPWRRSASPKLGTQRDIDDLRCLCVQVITMSRRWHPSWCSRRAAPARWRARFLAVAAPTLRDADLRRAVARARLEISRRAELAEVLKFRGRRAAASARLSRRRAERRRASRTERSPCRTPPRVADREDLCWHAFAKGSDRW